jgi:N-acetylglutamate synthase-like GNAT family acetyltransferase
VATKDEVHLIDGILKLYKSEGYLKPRTKAYLIERWNHFYVTTIDDIVVGCVEKKNIDAHTVEIAALAISTRFRNQKVGVFTVQAFIDELKREGVTRFISLTNNPSLEKLYRTMGFEVCRRPEYRERQAASPGVTMYFFEIT